MSTDAKPSSEAHRLEVAKGERFAFGRNWAQFLSTLTDAKIAAAEKSLRDMLGRNALEGRSFVDVGSGSGLFSLGARRLGAQVLSFDFDPDSVGCTLELKRRFYPADPAWTIEHGSALDKDYLARLGTFDIVYSWGVLHHTGQMWQALDNVHGLVASGGQLFIALYNDEGSRSDRWRALKRTYNKLPEHLKVPFAVAAFAPYELKTVVRNVLGGTFGDYIATWRRPNLLRGMNRWHDLIDWMGGYPYEVASPDEVFDFYRARGFQLERLVCKSAGSGCVEYVFRRV